MYKNSSANLLVKANMLFQNFGFYDMKIKKVCPDPTRFRDTMTTFFLQLDEKNMRFLYPTIGIRINCHLGNYKNKNLSFVK